MSAVGVLLNFGHFVHQLLEKTRTEQLD